MESLCLRLLVATYFYSLLTPGFILGFNFNYYFQSKSQYLSTVGYSYVQYPSFGLWYSYVFVFSTANLLLWPYLIIHHLPRSLAKIAIHTRALVTWTYTPPGLISTFHPAPYLYTSMSNSNPYPSSMVPVLLSITFSVVFYISFISVTTTFSILSFTTSLIS